MSRCKLGSLLTIKHGYAFKSECYVNNSSVVLVTLANISDKNMFKINWKKSTYYGADYPEEFNLYPDDLIMPLTEQVIGLFGNTALVPNTPGKQLVLNQRVAKIIPIEGKADKYFLHYLLASEVVKKQLEARASAGTKQRNIGPNDVYDVEVDVPDYPTQVKIGEFLHNLEKQICINSSLINKLTEYIDNVYDYWFLQFEYPNKNGRPYYSSDGKMVFNDELKMNIPLGWEVSNLKKTSLCTAIETGINNFDGYKTYLATADVDGINIFDGSTISFDNREGRANMQPVANSIWFAKMKNSIKHIAVTPNANWIIDNYIFSTGFTGLKCNKNSFSYLWSFISNHIFEEVKDKRSSGSTQEGINDEDLCLFPIIIPEQDIINKYNDLILPSIEKINSLIFENKKLENYMNYMLPLLINGQAKIGD